MSRTRGSAAPGTAGADPGGPLVALCVGHRCSALRRLAGTEDQLAQLRQAVGQTSGAVLVTADCVGACAVAAVAGVAHRNAGERSPGATVWLAGVQDADRAAALTDWVRDGGPGAGRFPDAGLPAPLAGAVAGLGLPPRLLGHGR